MRELVQEGGQPKDAKGEGATSEEEEEEEEIDEDPRETFAKLLVSLPLSHGVSG